MTAPIHHHATRRFTGWHMTAILVGFFAVVFGVNFMMARFAITTFGGEVVENSYVATERFNRWLDEAEREKALGWQAQAARGKDGRVRIALAKAPQSDVTLAGLARHPLGRLPDQTLAFVRQSDGSFVSVQALPAGRWRLRLSASAGKQNWRSEIEVS